MKVSALEASYPDDFYSNTLDGVSTHNLLNTIGIQNELHIVLNRSYLAKLTR
jgi:hypothetical protein